LQWCCTLALAARSRYLLGLALLRAVTERVRAARETRALRERIRDDVV